MQANDTIAAIATPAGRAGVGIVRLSGAKVKQIASLLSQKEAAELKPRYAHYRAIFSAEQELIDKVIMLYFKAPHSFTGEDVIEIHGHGAPVVLDAILKECVSHGARLARPGEFSERAFLNDKIDLTQAEAIADLIAANSMSAARMAMQSLEGEFSRIVNLLAEELLQLRIFVEAAIDFPEEEIDFLNDGSLRDRFLHLSKKIEDLRKSAAQGVLMREGLSIVIAGKPNAGKSTLINRLAGRELAIVTDVAGTTRDVMREYIAIDDLPVHIIDTAGLRESQDLVEKEGIKRAWQEVERADCVLMIVDIQHADEALELKQAIDDSVQHRAPIITVFNKIDAVLLPAKQEGSNIYLSAKNGDGIEFLKSAIKQTVGYESSEGKFLARRRHLDALNKADALLLQGQTQLTTARAFELVAEDLRLAHLALGEITGEWSSDDLLGEIFSSFCIGK